MVEKRARHETAPKNDHLGSVASHGCKQSSNLIAIHPAGLQ
jgi:hypothetical protein